MPGGFGSARSIVLLVVAAVAAWLASGFYRVQPGEQGVVMLFGKFIQTTEPGLNWYFPGPIGRTLTPDVEHINRIDVGFRGAGENNRLPAGRDVPEESLMLTGDQNIADLDFTVFWKIKNAGNYLFTIRDPEQTVKLAAESAMREVVGQTELQQALTGGRKQIEDRSRKALQQVLDSYESGILITDVKLLKVDPPQQVIDAFNEVQRARQDKERKQNEAETYRNKVVPAARGEAEKVIQEAKAYREKAIKEADGEAQRFLSVYQTYLAAKDVTQRRLYLETIEQVLKGAHKVMIDKGGAEGQPVVPFMALPDFKRPPPPKASTGGTGK